MKLNLFSVIKSNRAENDERIAGERMRATLSTLRFIQFIILFIQLAGQIMHLIFPENDILHIPQFVYILMILPFIVDPLYASLRGYIGSIRSDSIFFVIGMIEFGYTAYAIATYLNATQFFELIFALIAGMVVYYFIACLLYNLSIRINAKKSDESRDN